MRHDCIKTSLGLLVLFASVSTGLALGKHFSLDLSKAAPSGANLTAIPGSSSAVASRQFQLPLKAWLDTPHTEKGGTLKMKLVLTNIGSKDFVFPVSRRADTVQNNANADRRVFILAVRTRGGGTSLDPIIATTYSSASIPKSFVKLHPGDTLQVDLAAKLKKDKTPPNELITAGCVEWFIEPHRYFLSAQSAELVSNPVTVGPAGAH